MSRRPVDRSVPEASPNEGLVIRTEAGFHRVLIGDRVVVCRAPKRLLQGERTMTTAVVIGDHVRIKDYGKGTGVIEEVLARNNELVRGQSGGGRLLDVIAANLDQLVAVYSLREPELDIARLDKFLLIAEAAEIPALVCLNKVDLADLEAARHVVALYERIGYTVILTSARTGRDIERFHEAITDKLSALVGPSGVGKSSLLNAVQPGLRLRTAEVSEGTGTGRHTTTTAELLALHTGGWVADTPGLGELVIRDVETEDLGWLYPEFRPYLGDCRYSNCSHRGDSDCAVKAAVAVGVIPSERYASYVRVYDDLVEQRLPKY